MDEVSLHVCFALIGKVARKIVPPCLCADSEEKHEPASDIDSLKALDPDRPIREADIADDRQCPLGMSDPAVHCEHEDARMCV